MDWLLSKPYRDWYVVLALVVGVWLAGDRNCDVFVFGMDTQARHSLYQTLTGVSGGLLGFYIATVSILLGLLDSTKDRLKVALAGERRVELQEFFFAGIRAVSCSLIFFIVLLVADHEARLFRGAAMAGFSLVVLSFLRTVRIVWVLDKVVKAAARA